MKLAPLRRRGDALPGVSGVARLDRQTLRLAGRLNPGDIAIIDHVDLDRMAAEALVVAKPAAIVNAQPSISGRYPNLGPQLIVSHNILLLDNVGAEIFAAVKEGTKVRIDGHTVYVGETAVVTGTRQDIETVQALMIEAKSGLSSQLEAFAVNTAEFMARERRLLLDGEGIPDIKTRFAGKHAVIVVRGHDHQRDLKSLKHYIREYKPVLVGVDGGADALLEAGLEPHLIVGDMDAVSDAALATDNGAELVVAVGSHATLTEFLDRGRSGMASSFLTRLRLGSKVMDASGVARLYRNRISGAALLLLVIAALVAIVAALAASDAGRTYLDSLHHDWNDVV